MVDFGIFRGLPATVGRGSGNLLSLPGMVDSRITQLDEFEDLVKRYGMKRALKVQKTMFRHYNRLIYVDTQTAPSADQESVARSTAAHLNLSYREVAGTVDLLKALVNGPWDKRFTINPPGRAITLSDFSLPGSVDGGLSDG